MGSVVSSENEGPPELIHKWKRCDQCRHPQHSRRCVAIQEDTGGSCRCLALTPADQIAETCRVSGGCPEHPRPEPHEHSWGPWRPFMERSSEDPLEVATCACGASRVRVAEDPWHCRVEHEFGKDCPCPPKCGCCRSMAALPPKHPEGLTHRECPTCWRGDYDDCMCCHPELADAPMESPKAPSRRPPVAVSYAVEGGDLYEVLVPGDATVVAIDGMLQVTHGLPVAGIVQVAPYGAEKES